jgi:hypothetical protein
MSDAPVGGANPLAELIAGVRRMIPEPGVRPFGTGPSGDAGDEEQWRELATAVDELVEVVLVQQDLIENLLLRMSRVEGRDLAPHPERRGA